MRPVAGGRITTPFTEMRPLSKPIAERDHIHGAIDIAVAQGSPIFMPEDGVAWAWCAFRGESGIYWPGMPVVDDVGNPWCNYFYDIYGAILIVHTIQRTHIIAHSYANQLFNKKIFSKTSYYEEPEDSRWPLHALYTPRTGFKKGDIIGFVGNAGYSTGPHIHWEIHHGIKWDRWEERINPERWEG